jgi:ankyrin repeat protein
MSKALPTNPNLEFDKKQAKALLKAYRANEAEALERVLRHHPRLENVLEKIIPDFSLSDAQLVIAREYGFSSWAKLKAQIEALQAGFDTAFKQFVEAVQSGDTKKVRNLLQSSPQVAKHIDEPVIGFDAPAIVVAAGQNNRALVDLLLDNGADVNAQSVWWAGAHGVLHGTDAKMVEHLLERGANLDVFAAAEHGKMDVLRSLIEAEPSLIHAKGPDGQRALHYARSKETIDYLLEKGAEIDARDIDHNATAAQWMITEHPTLARYLLEKGATADIFMAARLGDISLLKKLLDADASLLDKRIGYGDYPDVPLAPGQHIYNYLLGNNKSPHQIAKQYGQSAAYDFLVERSSPQRRFAAACERGDLEGIQAILRDFPNVLSLLPQQDQLLLNNAAWENRLELVKLLLSLGFNPDLSNAEEMTPLHSAAFHGFSEIVKLLLQYNPKLEKRNVYGGTALGTSVYGSIHSWRKDGDFPATIEALLKAGMRPTPDIHFTGNEAVDSLLRPYLSKS